MSLARPELGVSTEFQPQDQFLQLRRGPARMGRRAPGRLVLVQSRLAPQQYLQVSCGLICWSSPYIPVDPCRAR